MDILEVIGLAASAGIIIGSVKVYRDESKRLSEKHERLLRQLTERHRKEREELDAAIAAWNERRKQRENTSR